MAQPSDTVQTLVKYSNIPDLSTAATERVRKQTLFQCYQHLAHEFSTSEEVFRRTSPISGARDCTSTGIARVASLPSNSLSEHPLATASFRITGEAPDRPLIAPEAALYRCGISQP